MDKRKLARWLREQGVKDYVVVVCDKKEHKVLMKGDGDHIMDMVAQALHQNGVFASEAKDLSRLSYVG